MTQFSKDCADGNFDAVISALETYKISRPWLLQLAEVNGWNCLHWTAWYNDIKCLKYLLTLKELDISARDSSGRTALHIALLPRTEHVFQNDRGRLGYPRDPPFEIVRMLLEAANDDISRYNSQDASTFVIALMCHHIDVVKLLIGCADFVRYSKSIFWHIAAMYQRVDCMRYLLSKPEFNLTVKDKFGWRPCFILFQNIIADPADPQKEDIDFAVELLLLTVGVPVDSAEVFFLLIDCFRYRTFHIDNRVQKIFTTILKLLLPHNPEKDVIQKIKLAKLPCDYSLILILLFERHRVNFNKCALLATVKERYRQHFEIVKLSILVELFSLYLVDQSLFFEYVAAIKRMTCRHYNRSEIFSKFCLTSDVMEAPKQVLFDFIKSVIFNGLDFLLEPRPNLSSLLKKHTPQVNDFLSNVFVPLSNLTNAPIDLLDIVRWEQLFLNNNFNPSDNCTDDYFKILDRKPNDFEVVSLKNISRMAVRKFYFSNYTHSHALTKLYNLDIPITLRQYLCYNPAYLKF